MTDGRGGTVETNEPNRPRTCRLAKSSFAMSDSELSTAL